MTGSRSAENIRRTSMSRRFDQVKKTASLKASIRRKCFVPYAKIWGYGVLNVNFWSGYGAVSMTFIMKPSDQEVQFIRQLFQVIPLPLFRGFWDGTLQLLAKSRFWVAFNNFVQRE